MTGGRTGRRPGNVDTREAILVAARGRFAAAGYRGASIRAIAGDAGVDPALVHHYFGTKRALFAAVLEVPADPAEVARRIVDAPRDEVGAAVVRTFLSVWGSPERRERLRVILASAATDPAVAAMVRDFAVDALLGPVAEGLDVDRPQVRATLAASQMIGFAFLGYVLRIESLESLDVEEVVALYGPTVQHHLTGDLDGLGVTG
ncbi:MAG: TetR family transcriptional regulator [Egicoccus sp.]